MGQAPFAGRQGAGGGGGGHALGVGGASYESDKCGQLSQGSSLGQRRGLWGWGAPEGGGGGAAWVGRGAEGLSGGGGGDLSSWS
jgi:hypothetical protein